MRVAIVFLVAGLAMSISAHPNLLSDIDLGPVLVLLLVTVPLTIILNAIEFSLTGQLMQVQISPQRCLETTILGSAANMLPLPGSTIVRIAALKAAGAGYTKSTAVSILVAINWLGIAFICAGVGFWSLQPQQTTYRDDTRESAATGIDRIARGNSAT